MGNASRIRGFILLIPKIAVTALLVVAISDMVIGVFMRYVVTAITDWLDIDPLNFFWVEEVGEYSLAWMTMIGAGIGIADRLHFTLHFLVHRFPPAAQRIIHIANHIAIAAFGGLAAWYGIQLAIVNSKLTSPALEINLAWLYAGPAVGGVLIILYAVAAAFDTTPIADPHALPETEGIAAAGDD